MMKNSVSYKIKTYLSTSSLLVSLLASLLASLPVWSAPQPAEDPASHPSQRRIPGGVALIDLDLDSPPERAVYQDRPVLIRQAGTGWQAVVGIALGAQPGNHALQVDGEKITFKVKRHDYEAQYITITDEEMVTPAQHKLKRIFAEQDEIRAAFRSQQVNTSPRLELHPPVAKARISGKFGVRRFINEQPRNPHSGLDLAAPEGTPIESAAAGKVVELGDYYFNGKSVLIDHGAGLVTMYCHMNEIEVERGDWVERGETIGTVGETGRATGAHLHFSVILNANPVDPQLFLQDI